MSKPRFFMGPAGAATDERLNMTDLRVLCILGTFTNNKGWCFPKQDKIAELLKRSRPVVCAALKRLEECGYIQIEKIPRTRNLKRYRVILDQKDDALDLPDGLFEVAEDVGPANISPNNAAASKVKPKLSAQQTCRPDEHIKIDMSAPQTATVGPADTYKELEPKELQKREKRAPRVPLHSLPDDWDPRDEEVKLAESLNFTRKQFDQALGEFRQYYLERAHLKKYWHSNWNMTFSKWVHNQARFWSLDRQKPAPWTASSVSIEPDWPAILGAWLESGAWKPSLGPTPDKRGYRGPVEPVQALLAGKDPNRPVIAAIIANLGLKPAKAAEDLFA